MSNAEAYRLIGERTTELAKMPDVQRKMLKVSNEQGIKAAENMLYDFAITTLFYGSTK